MAQRADILRHECSGWHSIKDCQRCPEYETCDHCDRGVCKYVAVTIFAFGESDELWCRPCCREAGWNEYEIASQAIDPSTGEYGENITKPDGSERD